MKFQFDTKEEAQEAWKTARSKSLGFCPLINAECKKSCVCYTEGDFYQPRPPDKHWKISYPGCNNVLIDGQISVYT